MSAKYSSARVIRPSRTSKNDTAKSVDRPSASSVTVRRVEEYAGAVVTHHPATLVGEIVAAERQLADIADRLAEWEAARGNAALPGSHANRAAIACDMAMGALERITETVQIASVPDGAA